MRCRKCGNQMSFLLVGNGGKRFYRCTGVNTSIREGGFRDCNAVVDESGRVMESGARIYYIAEGKAELYEVKDGRTKQNKVS